MKSKIFKSVVLGVFCLCLADCQYDPWASGFVTTQPPDKDIIGTYKVDSDSLHGGISIPATLKPFAVSPDAKIILSADYKAQFVNVPETDDTGSGICVISGTGSWQPYQGRYFIVFVQIHRNGFRNSADGCQQKYDGELTLYGKKPPYKLTVT